MITGNEPAMPFTAATERELLSGHLIGLTIRQHFAAMAMQANADNDDQTPAQIAKIAVELADALIAELNKPA